jgi:hypothetical protein
MPRAAVQKATSKRRPTIPYSGENSLFEQKKFPVFGGTGNPLQAIESVWRPAPKTAQRDGN